MNDGTQLSLGFGNRPDDARESGLPPAMSIEQARALGVYSALDVQFATRLAALYHEQAPEILWALALACRQEAQGHVCADLERLSRDGLLCETEGEVRRVSVLPGGLGLDVWEEALRQSPLIGSPDDELETADSATAPYPLVLDHRHRLYLRRSFRDQRFIAASLQRRIALADFEFDEELAETSIERFFRADASAHPEMSADPARAALRMGLSRPLSIVTGGPGTGKTTLVARLIALLVEQSLARGEEPPSFTLLAPTGKAAAAMTASFARQRDELGIADAGGHALPAKARTIHRALLPRTRRDAFGRGREFSLDTDIVVVDEASMVDLAMMRALFESTESTARVILLGDPDQLASVDSGAVLTELCDAAANVPALARSRVHLDQSHRFAAGGAIGLLARAIREGDADRTLEILDDPDHPEVSRRAVDSVSGVRTHLAEMAREMQREILSAAGPGAKLDRLASGRVLCAHRRGPLGSLALCEVLDAAAASVRETTSRSGWWRGRLLLVTRNAPEQDLWNGDVGLVEEIGGGLRAIFADAKGGVRTLSAGRLPSYESAIAMSVHKSQGSEFDRVELVLGDRASGLMTRELLYTGVTRARERLCLHASEEAIRVSLGRRVERDSGLADLLSMEG